MAANNLYKELRFRVRETNCSDTNLIPFRSPGSAFAAGGRHPRDPLVGIDRITGHRCAHNLVTMRSEFAIPEPV
jgi:hypothetical protein